MAVSIVLITALAMVWYAALMAWVWYVSPNIHLTDPDEYKFYD